MIEGHVLDRTQIRRSKPSIKKLKLCAKIVGFLPMYISPILERSISTDLDVSFGKRKELEKKLLAWCVEVEVE